MMMEEERRQIVEVGKLLYDRGLVQMSGGNISIIDRKANLVAIKPSGAQYIHMKPEDIIIVDMDGNVVEGNKKPSIETFMHLGIYKKRLEINAVVHCHPVHAVAWSLKHTYLPSVIAAQWALKGAVKVAPYEGAGTTGLADSALMVSFAAAPMTCSTPANCATRLRMPARSLNSAGVHRAAKCLPSTASWVRKVAMTALKSSAAMQKTD